MKESDNEELLRKNIDMICLLKLLITKNPCPGFCQGLVPLLNPGQGF